MSDCRHHRSCSGKCGRKRRPDCYRYDDPPWWIRPRLGACCRDGLCAIEEERDCLDTGGYWMGVDSRCWEVNCPGANSVVGACCFGGRPGLPGAGGCAILNERNCFDAGGLWMGPYSNCQACAPQQPPPWGLGAPWAAAPWSACGNPSGIGISGRPCQQPWC